MALAIADHVRQSPCVAAAGISLRTDHCQSNIRAASRTEQRLSNCHDAHAYAARSSMHAAAEPSSKPSPRIYTTRLGWIRLASATVSEVERRNLAEP